jgi:hypothetical protein
MAKKETTYFRCSLLAKTDIVGKAALEKTTLKGKDLRFLFDD